MKAKRQMKIDGLIQLRNVAEVFVDEMDGGGRLRRVSVKRRMSHPFEALYVSGGLSGEDRAAAYDLIRIYARSKGLAGRPAEDLGVVVQEVPDAHAERLRMAKYGVAFGEVMARLDPWPALLLRRLIADFVEGDGARVEGDGVRWRGLVREAALAWNRCLGTAQAAGNAAGVAGGRVDVRESEAGRVVARAISACVTGGEVKGGEVKALGQMLDEVRQWVKTARPEMARYFYG